MLLLFPKNCGLQCADGNKGQNFKSLNEGYLCGAKKTEKGNWCVILGGITNVNLSARENFNAGLKRKDLLNCISFNNKWCQFLFEKFIPMRCDFLKAVYNIKSSNYLPLTWTRKLFSYTILENEI